jgi:hypothetical protein
MYYTQSRVNSCTLCEISGSHSSDNEDDCLLGCCAMQYGRSLLMFQGALMIQAASTSETLVNFYQTTWCSNPKDSQSLSCTLYIPQAMSNIKHNCGVMNQLLSKHLQNHYVCVTLK